MRLQRYMERCNIIIGGVVLGTLVLAGIMFALLRPQPPSTNFIVRQVVNGFGDEMSQVSLLAPASALAEDMDEHYALYIHPTLLESWKQNPSTALGRHVSSPYPDTIEIASVMPRADGTYAVQGNIIYKTNTAGTTTVTAITRAQFILSLGPDGWQITGYELLDPLP